MFNILKIFLQDGYCENCSKKGKGKCKVVCKIECLAKRKTRKDKGMKRMSKEEREKVNA